MDQTKGCPDSSHLRDGSAENHHLGSESLVKGYRDDDIICSKNRDMIVNLGTKHAPLPENLIMLLLHALKQGLTLRLQGIGLSAIMVDSASSNKLFLSSSRLMKFLNFGMDPRSTNFKKQNGKHEVLKLYADKLEERRVTRQSQGNAPLILRDESAQNVKKCGYTNHVSHQADSEAIFLNDRVWNTSIEAYDCVAFDLASMQAQSSLTRYMSDLNKIDSNAASTSIVPLQVHDPQGLVSSVGQDLQGKFPIDLCEPKNMQCANSCTIHYSDPPYNSGQMGPTAPYRSSTELLSMKGTEDKVAGNPLDHMNKINGNMDNLDVNIYIKNYDMNGMPQPHSHITTCCQDSTPSLSSMEATSKISDEEPPRWAQGGNQGRDMKCGLCNSHSPFQASENHLLLQHVCGYPMTPERGFKSHLYSVPRCDNALAQSCPCSFQSSFCSFIPSYPNQWQPTFYHSSNVQMEGTMPSHPGHSHMTGIAPRGHLQDNTTVSRPQFMTQDCSYHSPASEDQLIHYPEISQMRRSSFNQRTISSHQPLSSLKLKKLLWVSEEEAEIIRLIRLSQEKEMSRCSSSYYVSEQPPSTVNTRVASEIHDDVNLNDLKDGSHFSSRVSLSSVEDFKLPEDGVLSLADLGAKCTVMIRKEQDFILSEDGQQSGETHANKQVCASKQKAAACIQYFWRKHITRRLKESEKRQHLEALKFTSELPAGLEHMLQAAVMASEGGLLLRWYSTMREAVEVIQKAWRQSQRRKREELLAPKALPKDIKDLYKLVMWRHVSKGLTPPTYESFVVMLERLQAATEGARIRRRLRSRRLQIIIKEIKEIRLLLYDLSDERNIESCPNLLPQLSAQLQQKLLQLQTALTGPQDTARVLLRRCPATPLVICTSKSSHAEPSTTLPSANVENQSNMRQTLKSLMQKSVNIQKAKSESMPTQNLRFMDVEGQNLVPMEEKVATSLCLNEDKKTISLENVGKTGWEQRSNSHYLLAIRKKTSQEAIQKKELSDYDESRKEEQKGAVECSVSPVDFFPSDDLDKVCGKRTSINLDVEEMCQMFDAPKHPFLRRKSKVMHPQKLDWSKVKPMVSSRLEPELKTRLLKTKFKGATSRKKRNFNQIKSKLFSYERTNVEDKTTNKDLVFEGLLPLNRDSDKNNNDAALALDDSMKMSNQPSLRYSQGGNVPYESFPKEAGPSSGYARANIELLNQFSLHQQIDATESSSQKVKELDQAISKNVDLSLSQLEKMFDSIIVKKDGRALSLEGVFGQHQESIVPRLHPNSLIFKCNCHERNEIHQLLSREGRAERLHHKCLSFVSIHD